MTSVAKQAAAAPAAGAPAAKPANNANQKLGPILNETAQHVKDTIESINELSKDLKRVDMVLAVGQKFNAFVGTFPYLESIEGIKQLRILSEVLDNLARTYSVDPNQLQSKKSTSIFCSIQPSATTRFSKPCAMVAN